MRLTNQDEGLGANTPGPSPFWCERRYHCAQTGYSLFVGCAGKRLLLELGLNPGETCFVDATQGINRILLLAGVRRIRAAPGHDGNTVPLCRDLDRRFVV